MCLHEFYDVVRRGDRRDLVVGRVCHRCGVVERHGRIVDTARVFAVKSVAYEPGEHLPPIIDPRRLSDSSRDPGTGKV